VQGGDAMKGIKNEEDFGMIDCDVMKSMQGL
jgi:hypothetical protein